MLIVSCTSIVAKTNIFESVQLDLPPPLVYSLYSCENAENNGWMISDVDNNAN